MVLGGKDGGLAAQLKLPCEPIAPPVVADFSDDGWNDVVLTCRHRYIASLPLLTYYTLPKCVLVVVFYCVTVEFPV